MNTQPVLFKLQDWQDWFEIIMDLWSFGIKTIERCLCKSKPASKQKASSFFNRKTIVYIHGMIELSSQYWHHLTTNIYNIRNGGPLVRAWLAFLILLCYCLMYECPILMVCILETIWFMIWILCYNSYILLSYPPNIIVKFALAALPNDHHLCNQKVWILPAFKVVGLIHDGDVLLAEKLNLQCLCGECEENI